MTVPIKLPCLKYLASLSTCELRNQRWRRSARGPANVAEKVGFEGQLIAGDRLVTVSTVGPAPSCTLFYASLRCQHASLLRNRSARAPDLLGMGHAHVHLDSSTLVLTTVITANPMALYSIEDGVSSRTSRVHTYTQSIPYMRTKKGTNLKAGWVRGDVNV